MKCYQHALLLIGVTVLLIYFLLQKIEVPDGNIIKERMVFYDFYPSHGDGFINNRFSRSVVYMVGSNNNEFRFSSNGYVVGFIQENYKNGEHLDVYWFYTCHEFIRRNSLDCIEVIGAGDSDIEYVSELYRGKRTRKIVLLSSVFVFVFLLSIAGCVLGKEKENDL